MVPRLGLFLAEDTSTVMSAADEIVVIVDEHNNVVGAAPRREMRGQRLPHRSTYILVFNSQGALYVQKPARQGEHASAGRAGAAGGSTVRGDVNAGSR